MTRYHRIFNVDVDICSVRWHCYIHCKSRAVCYPDVMAAFLVFGLWLHLDYTFQLEALEIEHIDTVTVPSGPERCLASLPHCVDLSHPCTCLFPAWHSFCRGQPLKPVAVNF